MQPNKHDVSPFAVALNGYDSELVPAQSRDDIGVASDFAQRFSCQRDERIAHRMTGGVIHLLQAVQVNDKDSS